jgi:hypothetical protein
MWLDSHLESNEMVARPGRRPGGRPYDGEQPRVPTWSALLAGLTVFGLLLAAFALLMDVLAWTS